MVLVELAHGVLVNVRLAGFGPDGSNRHRILVGTCDGSAWHGVGEVALERDEDLIEGRSGIDDRPQPSRPPGRPPMMPPPGIADRPKFICPGCSSKFETLGSLVQHLAAKGQGHVEEPKSGIPIQEQILMFQAIVETATATEFDPLNARAATPRQ